MARRATIWHLFDERCPGVIIDIDQLFSYKPVWSVRVRRPPVIFDIGKEMLYTFEVNVYLFSLFSWAYARGNAASFCEREGRFRQLC